jgi:hypothetical protein
VIQKRAENLNNPKTAASEDCSVCKDLLSHMDRFFQMFETARRSPASEWLTVDDIAKELKVSKSIVYRLIRHGELEAVDIVDSNGEIPKKGHYRIKRSRLDEYLESKKVSAFPNQVSHPRCSRRPPKVKNHLGL